MARSKAYLFSGVEIRWKSAIEDGDTPTEATFHFPGGLADYPRDRLEGAATYSETPFSGRVEFAQKFGDDTPGSVEWAVNWTPARDGFINSYCNTVPTPEGGTHEQGLRLALAQPDMAYAWLLNNDTLVERQCLAAMRDALVDRDKLKKRERPFNVPTTVSFDNEGSDIYTIVEVDTRDRPGLLYDLTRALEEVVARCLEKDPTDRFQTARDVASELRLVGKARRGERILISPPTPSTPLLGREQTLGEAIAKLEEGARVLTVSGYGGTGKTRFSIELFRRLSTGYEAGAAFVSLASVTDATEVMSTVTSTLPFSSITARSPVCS